MPPNTNQEKLFKKLKRYSDVRIIGLVVFGIIVLLVTWSGLQVMQTNYELQKKEASLRAENENKKLENSNLKLENKYLETDHYLELTARRQFNKAAPGEQLHLVPEEVALRYTVDLPKTQSQIREEQSTNKSKYQQNFEAWLDFFFHGES